MMDNLYLPEDWKVQKVKEEVKDHFFLSMVPPDGREVPFYCPGQFFEVSLPGLGEAPFSVSSTPTKKGSLEMCIRKVGRVTRGISRIRPGDQLGLRGPLGNGYPLEKIKGRDILIIAGGLGIVPLRSLINYVSDKSADHGQMTILYGANEDSELLFLDELLELNRRPSITVNLIVRKLERGPSHPKKLDIKSGLVTELIPGACENPDRTFVALCGPPVFYRYAIQSLLTEQYNKSLIFMSLERRMECGIGKCGHCSVGYRYTCIDGPIFNYWDAFNLPEMIEMKEGESWIS